jgi:Rab GDP dissociation inhibitor
VLTGAETTQAFARLSAVYGGTYMLGQSDATVVLGEDGVVQGVRAGGQLARCRAVVGDPSYFPQRVTQTGRVRRALCILVRVFFIIFPFPVAVVGVWAYMWVAA